MLPLDCIFMLLADQLHRRCCWPRGGVVLQRCGWFLLCSSCWHHDLGFQLPLQPATALWLDTRQRCLDLSTNACGWLGYIT